MLARIKWQDPPRRLERVSPLDVPVLRDMAASRFLGRRSIRCSRGA